MTVFDYTAPIHDAAHNVLFQNTPARDEHLQNHWRHTFNLSHKQPMSVQQHAIERFKVDVTLITRGLTALGEVTASQSYYNLALIMMIYNNNKFIFVIFCLNQITH